MDRKSLLDPLRQNILEAVDCLRQRKCRPDRESIAHYVLRKFGSTMNEIFAELENIVDENGLIKVEYKGTTSYRSPSNFDTKNSPLLTKHSKILNSSKTTRFIITGINELLVKDPNYAKDGVPLVELKQTLVGFDEVRFGDEYMDVILEREKNYGTIQIAKSTILTDSLRVFPKDIPVPDDMITISLGLTAAAISNDKEDKKPRKPRKSNAAAATSTTAGAQSAKKGKGKKEVVAEKGELQPVTVFAVKSDPPLDLETDEGIVADGLTPKKNPRMTPAGRKSAPVKLDDDSSGTSEVKSEFETKSAQMVKLAAAVVNKQGDESQSAQKQNVPTLVLADRIKAKTNNGETSPEKDAVDDNAGETSKTNQSPIVGKKRRGRPPLSLDSSEDKTAKDAENDKEDSKDERDDEEEVDTDKASPSNDQGLTRSKRDKRKKQVFDPSDLPNTYSKYSNSLKSTRKSRINRSPSYEEPPTKKAVVARRSRASLRKSVPVESEEKRVSRSTSKKTNDGSQSNVNTKPIENIEGDNIDEPESMDTDENEEAATETNAEETKNIENSLSEESKISTESNPEIKSVPSSGEKRCEYCLGKKSTDSQVDGIEEELLSCASCLANIHPSCMDYSSDLTIRIKELNKKKGSIQWECFDCKTCRTCGEKLLDASSSTPKKTPTTKTESHLSSEKNDKSNHLQFILCEHCDVGFHAKCIKIETKGLKKPWICQGCKPTPNKKKKVSMKGKNPKKPTTKKQSSVASKVSRSLRTQPKQDTEVLDKCELPVHPITKSKTEATKVNETGAPRSENSDAQNREVSEDSDDLDITSWTPSDVEAFFIEKGLKDEAAILKEQDMDGYSLLLLRRDDIIHGLHLRLGPALKVNRLITELQAKAPVRAKWPDAESTEKADIVTPETS